MGSNAPKKLSLLSAISINLNVLIGTGLFINTYKIATSTGTAGFFLYPTLGLCMLPLIAVFGKLLEQFQQEDYTPLEKAIILIWDF